MAPLFLLLALPATLLATVEAVGFFRGLRPLPMPLPIMPLVHPVPLVHPMTFPFMPLPQSPGLPSRRTRTKTTTNQVRSVPMNVPLSERQGDVIVVINDRDCFSGLCRGGGFGGGLGGPAGFIDGIDMMGRRPGPGLGGGRSSFSINDADHVIIGGNGRY